VVLAEVHEVLGDVEADRYGEGGVVTELEGEVAALLGKPAAVLMPSGTMAQQIALRIHAERTGRRTVLWHPACHLALWEDQAVERLHGLHPRPVGDARQLITLSDLEEVAEYAAALLLELPQREIGGRLPEWDDLVAQTELARSHGTATHLDGARLLESLPFYGRPAAEVAACSTASTCRSTRAWAASAAACSPGTSSWSRRHASGGTGTAAPCSSCGPTRRPGWPGCGCGPRGCRRTWSRPRRSRPTSRPWTGCSSSRTRR
jgi:hypothetical protein